MENKTIKIYTDGSCHTQFKIGSWAALIFSDNKKDIIKGCLRNTTHNQMELMSVIKALEHVESKELAFNKIEVYSDSQYVVDISKRKEKLISNAFLTKAGKQVQNTELLKLLISYLNRLNIEIFKVVAHQKANETQNYNRVVDIIVRKILREEVKYLNSK